MFVTLFSIKVTEGNGSKCLLNSKALMKVSKKAANLQRNGNKTLFGTLRYWLEFQMLPLFQMRKTKLYTLKLKNCFIVHRTQKGFKKSLSDYSIGATHQFSFKIAKKQKTHFYSLPCDANINFAFDKIDDCFQSGCF